MNVIEGVLAGAFPRRNPNAQVFNVTDYAGLLAAITAAVAGNGDIILIDSFIKIGSFFFARTFSCAFTFTAETCLDFLRRLDTCLRVKAYLWN